MVMIALVAIIALFLKTRKKSKKRYGKKKTQGGLLKMARFYDSYSSCNKNIKQNNSKQSMPHGAKTQLPS